MKDIKRIICKYIPKEVAFKDLPEDVMKSIDFILNNPDIISNTTNISYLEPGNSSQLFAAKVYYLWRTNSEECINLFGYII